MAQMWIPQSIEIYKYWCKTIIEEAEDELSDWELKFIDNIDNRLLMGYNLTEAQANKLESIYSSKTK
jgi:hypothetical protein